MQIEKLGIDSSTEQKIINYINTIYREYKVPIDGIKEIPLNLKGNQKYFAIFYYGTLYSNVFFKMTDEEKRIFLSYIVEELKVSSDIIDYTIQHVIPVKDEKIFLTDIINSIIDNKFTEKDKYYMLFSYGLLFKYI